MPLKPHPTDPDKMVYASRWFDAVKEHGSSLAPEAIKAAIALEGAPAEQEHCQCPACKDGKLHWSDCAVHDEPALAAELCNCGVVNPRIVTQRDTPSEAFFDWWGSDYDDSSNPFRKGAMAYWAFAGWQAALAQPAQRQPLTDDQIEDIAAKTMFPINFARAIEAAIEEALAQPVQEPMAWLLKYCHKCPLPPQRPWVGLTDEEISALSKGHMTRNGFARNVLAKSKEKNT